ncbi:hypothetical protein BD324DRAFT_684210 [Kockovaella imperatae]|uniref:GET complex, subunit GET2 n=1 Tax=Kockovaella imperatae TaxID=4999 RepID=A0A1Y1U7I6_9TREE|nr:hypothetical protein BD324DRAFT_684210 [Kockovaella imperatae]ORX33504.1 hypothetical protein BD324DRAFT_684210 [Kockovaella imperatae]
MSDIGAQSDAAKRAAARKAKILARGNAGLQKLAQTARGEEADKLYGEDSRPTSPSSESTSASSPTSGANVKSAPKASSWASTGSGARAGAGAGAGAGGFGGMSEEQQRMQQDLAAMFGGFPGMGGPGGPGGGAGAGGEGMPDMSRLLAQMMGGMSGPPGQGQNLLGDLDDPAGLGTGGPFGGAGAGAGGAGGMPPMPPGMAEMFSGLNGGGAGGGFPGMPGMPGLGGGGGGGGSISKSQRYFPLIHAGLMLLLGLFTVIWWEPSLRGARLAGKIDPWWARRWAGLAGRAGVVDGLREGLLGGVEVLPLFWAFTTVQLILHTTRIMILKSPPPPHSLISTFLPLMPPAISRPLITGSRYVSLLSQLYKDGALLIFIIGMTTVLGQWRSTGVAPSYH